MLGSREAIALDRRAPEGATTAVRRLMITCLRSYERLDLDVDERSVVLTGANGAGKTNILEALSMLAPGRGLRGAGLRDLVRRRSGEPATFLPTDPARLWTVAARLQVGADDVQIGTGLDIVASGAVRRVVRINGAPASGPAALGRYVRAVWVTPAMDRLFMEGAGQRRRFLDRLVLAQDPDHAQRVALYEKAQRERQRLLRDGPWDDLWLEALEQTMAESGAAIAAARNALVARLSRAAGPAESLFPRARLSLEGELETALTRRPAVEVEDAFRATLREGRRRDAEAGRCLNGPHRTDLVVVHAQKGVPAHLCSTGEQKALLIGLVLAHARELCAEANGVPPLLLLDEIAAHLDGRRRAALFDEICTLGCQAWMTGTDSTLFAPLGARAQHFTVSDGRVRLKDEEERSHV